MNKKQMVRLDKIDIWHWEGHRKTEDGFEVDEKADGKSTEEHKEGIKYFKKLIKEGKKILPPLLYIRGDGYIELDGFKRVKAYQELQEEEGGYDRIEAFVCDRDIKYAGKTMRCGLGGQSYLVFKHAIDYQGIADEATGFYGHGVYQTIHYKGDILVDGGRKNLLERWNMVDLNDIKGKTIVDIGCNAGGTCILAMEYGAKKAYGFDVREDIINVARQIADGLELDIEYEIADFGKDQPKKGDTAFCFAIDKYMDREVLANNLAKYDVVYFETHLNQEIPEVIASKFKVELLGTMIETNNQLTRKIYRLAL